MNRITPYRRIGNKYFFKYRNQKAVVTRNGDNDYSTKGSIKGVILDIITPEIIRTGKLKLKSE